MHITEILTRYPLMADIWLVCLRKFIEKNFKESKKYWDEMSLKLYGAALPFPSRRSMSNYTYAERKRLEAFREKENVPFPIIEVDEEPPVHKVPFNPYDRDTGEYSNSELMRKAKLTKKSRLGSQWTEPREE